MNNRRKRSKVSPLSAEITSVMRGMFRKNRYCHPEIWARWTQIVGQEIARRAFPKSLKSKILVVGVSNSSWLQELSFLKTDLLDRLAEAVGPQLVSEIRFVLDHGRGNTSPRETREDGASKPAPKLPPLEPQLMEVTEKLGDDDLKERIRRAAAANLHKRRVERGED